MREWTQSVANLFFLSERCTNAFYVGPTDVIPLIDSERYVTVEIVGYNSNYCSDISSVGISSGSNNSIDISSNR